MRLADISHSFTDFLCEVSQFAQIIEHKFLDETRRIPKNLNLVCDYVRKNTVSVLIPSLKIDSLRVFGISDAYFENKKDL